MHFFPVSGRSCDWLVSLSLSFFFSQVDDQKRHRYDVADVLRDVSRILGGVPCLQQLVVILEQEVRFFVLFCVCVCVCVFFCVLCFAVFFSFVSLVGSAGFVAFVCVLSVRGFSFVCKSSRPRKGGGMLKSSIASFVFQI